MSVLIHKGEKYHLGLLPSYARPVSVRSITELVGEIPSHTKMIEMCESKDRPNMREIFQGRKWIGNQNPLNSCCAYANKHRLERIRYLRGLEHVALSAEGLYAYINSGRDMGASLEAGENMSCEVGFAPESMITLRKFYTTRTIPAAARAEMSRFMLDETYHIDSELELVWACLNQFISVVAVHVTNAYMDLDANGVRRRSPGLGNHAVCIQDVRYNRRTGRFEFDEAGSWDLSNGDQGYAWLDWEGHLARPNQYHRFNAGRTSSDDPKAVNPPAI